MKNLWMLAGLMMLYSCGQETKQEETQATTQQKQQPLSDEHYMSLGDSVATNAQKLLLQNLVNAIKEKGIAEAVGYCSENAIPLTAQAAHQYQVTLQRISDKNRNPNNSLQEEQDMQAWTAMQQLMQDTNKHKKQLLVNNEQGATYYKAITIGMPTCLSCHGEKDKDIAATTWNKIQTTYPKDKAHGYQMGQLRGLWKVRFTPVEVPKG